ncbi:MAG: 3-isopropylmalate dehydratase small subunit [Legionellales bacterium]|jgi:3-isopropylmalate/(R)-2-methylmalate dehydratase small subunit|nr:3-isopropylmalate dehydratase small subunit [Legionellales bacterium]HBH10662.1 3-isopropylmalate dehydratase small subunit [Gammaproteobacteria bacterium]|tara:strand:+ start:1245 stop:1889 length:645 start_codon:yes stop_codon:yes gene_type:complete
MKTFKTFTGIIAPLDRSNIDTDTIIPKEYLKSIKRTGFGLNLFDSWRYIDSNENTNQNIKRKDNPNFILNKSPYNKAEILLARENFGCGSSREHAVWALSDFGFKAVLAPSYGDIFYSNCFKNGFLPIKLKNKDIDLLFNLTKSNQGLKATVDLEKQFVETNTDNKFRFDIEPNLKVRLLKGLDEIALTLEYSDAIYKYERTRAKMNPWLFKDI